MATKNEKQRTISAQTNDILNIREYFEQLRDEICDYYSNYYGSAIDGERIENDLSQLSGSIDKLLIGSIHENLYDNDYKVL